MKTTIELDSSDIKKIIAEHFKVNKEDVIFTVKRFTAGYGMGEHYEYMPTVTIKYKNKEMRLSLENKHYGLQRTKVLSSTIE